MIQTALVSYPNQHFSWNVEKNEPTKIEAANKKTLDRLEW